MKKAILWSMLASLSFVIYGCGSGDFFSGGTTISGVASKGPISGASVAIFSVTTSGHRGIQLAPTAITDANGKFSANIGSYTGAIFATMSGSSASYIDETTGKSTGLGSQRILRAAALVNNSGQMNLAITPLTEIAYQLANNATGNLTFANISSANNLVGRTYLKGLPAGSSIISTLPANVLTGTMASDPAQIGYGLVLATISNLITPSQGSASSLAQVIVSMSSINASTSTPTNASVQTAFSVLPTSSNLQSGITDTPMGITLTPSASGVVANNTATVTFTALVNGLYDLPLSGTSVTFAVTSGTATFANGLSTQTVTVDSSGNPSQPVALKSSEVQNKVTVTVTAAGMVTASTNIAFGQDPAIPTSVNLVASPASNVVADGTTASTITATVTNFLGTGLSNIPVTFTIAHGSGILTSGSTTSSSSVSATTNASGVATVSLTSLTAGSVTLSAVPAGTGLSGSATVIFIANPAAPAKVTVSASSTSEPADGSTPINFTINVTNSAGGAISGVPLTISYSGVGTPGATTATTDANGNATVTLTSSAPGSATVSVSATAAGVTATGSSQVSFTAFTRPTTATVTILTSGTFTSGNSIGGISATLTYPTTKGLTPTSETVSGSAASGTLPEFNVNTSGEVIMGIISSSGFALGQFATITFSIGTGTPLPAKTDFVIASGFTVTNAAVPPVTQPNISVITSVTIQ